MCGLLLRGALGGLRLELLRFGRAALRFDDLDRLFLRRAAAGGGSLEADVREARDGLSKRLVPSHADLYQRRVIGIEAALALHVELIDRVCEQVDRRADRDVRFHRAVQRQQRVLRGLLQRRAIEANAAVEDRPAILGFTDLEERRIFRRRQRIRRAVPRYV